jgi:hypothetical protein
LPSWDLASTFCLAALSSCVTERQERDAGGWQCSADLPVGVAGQDSSFSDSTGKPYQGIKFGYYSANILWRDSRRTVW